LRPSSKHLARGARKQADIALVRGDPAGDIRDIENVELVVRRCRGYDSRKLIESVTGQVGIQ